MGEMDNRDREEIYSESVRAGKRTYFFDVKATRANEQYLTITESKKRFNNEDGRFYYEKHKIFLYKEDFMKFKDGLEKAIGFIESEQPDSDSHSYADVDFSDLDKEAGDTAFEEDHQ